MKVPLARDWSFLQAPDPIQRTSPGAPRRTRHRQPLSQPLSGHTNSVQAVAFSPDGHLLATASDDKSVRLWDPATGQPVGQPLTAHANSVRAVAFSPDGCLLATASDDKTIRLWGNDP